MHEPSLVIRGDDRDAQGNLRPEHLEEISRILQAPGFVLLPSDTAYSIAAWLDTAQIRDNINKMLNRDDDPISLAFPSLDLVQKWTEPNRVADGLFDALYPGPITVVCRASCRIPAEVAEEAWRSQNRTIGVRIPNSAEEWQVAGAGENDSAGESRSPRWRYGTREQRACHLVHSGRRDRAGGHEAIGGARWCAIEGEIRYRILPALSRSSGKTGVTGSIRHGAIPEEEIRACIADTVAALQEG